MDCHDGFNYIIEYFYEKMFTVIINYCRLTYLKSERFSFFVELLVHLYRVAIVIESQQRKVYRS